MDPLEKSFRVFGECDIAKSLETLKGTVEQPTDILIKGRVLNSVRDESGEIPVVAEFDWSYFDKQGFVKAEHDPTETSIEKSTGKVTITSKPTFSNIIGVPMGRTLEKGGKETHVTAGIFTDVPAAQAAIKLMKALDDWNKKHPNNQRTIGWSIEGGYLKKSKTGHYVGKVYNVALTANPQDATTYAEMVKSLNLNLAKSLMAGYGSSPAEQSDGGALRRESLEGSTKDTHTDSKKKKERKMKFATRHEATVHFAKEGKTGEDLKKAVNDHFTQQEQERNEGATAFAKSITAITAICTDATAEIDKLVQSLETPDEAVRLDVELKKSVKMLNAGDGENVDMGDLFVRFMQGSTATTEQQRQVTAAMLKSVAGLYKAVGEIANAVQGIQKSQDEIRSLAQLSTERSTQVLVGLKKSTISVTSDTRNIEAAPGAGEQKNEEEIMKSVSKVRVANFLADRSASESTYARHHDQFLKGGLGSLPVAVQTEVRKHFVNQATA